MGITFQVVPISLHYNYSLRQQEFMVREISTFRVLENLNMLIDQYLFASGYCLKNVRVSTQNILTCVDSGISMHSIPKTTHSH